jgi:hypothetical protein
MLIVGPQASRRLMHNRPLVHDVFKDAYGLVIHDVHILASILNLASIKRLLAISSSNVHIFLNNFNSIPTL